MNRQKFNEGEIRVLRCLQKSLPDTLNPFLEIASICGVSEDTVISLINELKDSGCIRRFGATLKHQKAGYTTNLMVAWKVSSLDEADEVAELFVAKPEISHCYYRPSDLPEWTYTLFTMLHGRSEIECKVSLNQMVIESGLSDYAILESIRELKKTSMLYF